MPNSTHSSYPVSPNGGEKNEETLMKLLGSKNLCPFKVHLGELRTTDIPWPMDQGLT